VLSIRPAEADDQPLIVAWVKSEGLDPTTLKWEHFLLALDGDKVVGIGQVKELPGCRELGSLIVAREYRHQGVARQLIGALEAKAGLPLYLMCRSRLEPFYQQFGYEPIVLSEMPAFLRLKWLGARLFSLFGIHVSVMRKL
jgi:amino-acid N-acetyltransferase